MRAKNQTRPKCEPITEAPQKIKLPVDEMALLSFVRWDRYTEDADGVSMVFGWIDREDGRSDFVILRPGQYGLGFSTSSAEYSEEISRLLNGGEPTGTHEPCIRVENHPDAAELPNVIRQPVIPQRAPKPGLSMAALKEAATKSHAAICEGGD